MVVGWLEQSLADVPDEDTWLSADEKQRCDCFHIPKRRADWRLGRWTAKNAVAAYMNLPNGPGALAAIVIRPAASGAPEVSLRDQPASVGISISHRANVGVCAVAPSGVMLGCDLELVEPRTPAFLADYFTTEEQAMVAASDLSERDRLAALLWSAKESALKALRVGLRIDTRCIEVSLGENSSTTPTDSLKSTARASSSNVPLQVEDWRPLVVTHLNGQSFQGWWMLAGELIRTMVSVPASSAPRMVSALPRGSR